MRPPLAKVTDHLASESFRPGYSASYSRTRNITFEECLFGLWLKEREILQFEARLFWFMAYRTRNITFEVR